MTAIYWLRNDLRLEDNHSLDAFSKEKEGAFLFVESRSFKRAHSKRKEFFESELSHLAFTLQSFDQKIYRSSEHLLFTLEKIHAHSPISKMYFSKEYAVEEKEDENLVINFCHHHQIKVIATYQQTTIHLDDLPFSSVNDLPFIFTDFRKQVEQNLHIRPAIKKPTQLPLHNDLSPLYSSILPKENFDTGLKRIKYYFFESHKVKNYKQTRNGLIDFDDSTKFSKWLNTGSLSPRTVWEQLKLYEQQYGANESTYWVFFELLWRDYFKFLSLKYQHKIFLKEGITNQNQTPTSFRADIFKKWKTGNTGNDFIDAFMRELNHTGFMSNRGRQNVASFLIHDLNISWIHGAKYFEKMLIDYDPDINYGNWLYLSGNGTDPRSRKFNIEKQAHDYDPDRSFRKIWLESI